MLLGLSGAYACTTISSEATSTRISDARSSELEIPNGEPLIVRDTGTTTDDHIVRLRPGAHVRPSLGDGSRGVIVIESAKDMTLDLEGVDLRGTPPGSDLDLNTGFGIVLRNCERVTVRGGKLGGYKVCIAAFDCRDLVLDGVQFDGWYGSRLRSTRVAEDASDWLYPHHNDAGEWMKNYGAAIALNDCERVTIKNCRGRHGQNGILLTRTSGCSLYDDDFSFLSGWGLALYRSSSNSVSHCRFDYCVRGYSQDVYWRGQDSAGILMFERSSDNVFALCSATHSGDGVFLFGGNDTVEGHAFDKGELDAGGSDRNTWFGCDFSYAVANAIEATFSRDNKAVFNKLNGSHQHGIWAGYSSRMLIANNEIRGTLGGGISIEHGQECVVAENVLEDNDIALELWWDEDESLVQGPFGKRRDTASRDHFVWRNRFEDNARDLVLTKTSGVWMSDNLFRSRNKELVLDKVTAKDESGRAAPDVRKLLAGRERSMPAGRLRESSIRAWDHAWPAGYPTLLSAAPRLPGSMKALGADRGATVGLDTIVMGDFGPWDFESGEPRPKQREPGGLLAHSTWYAAWFPWKADAADPRKDLALWRGLIGTPSAQATVTTWTDPWGADRAVRKEVGNSHFGLVASTSIDIAVAGMHRLTTMSDDGVRVIVDGQSALENWTWHGPTRDSVDIELTQGRHEFVLEYFQIDGAYALSIELEAVAPR